MIKIDLETAWRADEVRRFDLAIRAYGRRSTWFKRILEEIDRELPEYERPLKSMPYKKKALSILRALKHLIP